DEHGVDVPHNLLRAFYWFHRAAPRGSVDAQVALGVMYEVGAGVPLNYARARKWFLLAAARENPTAQVNLGMMDAKAQGVPQNLVKAYTWLELAQTGSASGTENYTVTQGAMALLRTHMPPKQIALAQQDAQAWLAAHPRQKVL
ncbi:TPR repeat protein, partial [mine drainage metagenome]